MRQIGLYIFKQYVLDCVFHSLGRSLVIFIYVTLFEFSVDFKLYTFLILSFAQPGPRGRKIIQKIYIDLKEHKILKSQNFGHYFTANKYTYDNI